MDWLKPNRAKSAKPSSLSTTITYLEMNTPQGIPAQCPANIHVALLGVSNIPLHFYRYLYFNVGIHWNWEMRLRLSDDELAKAVHADHTEITVLYVDGAPSGFFEVNRQNPNSTDLAYFGMMPHAFGRGLGKWFLASAIDACWAGKPERISVNTCTLDHPAALPLYQKMGFKPYKQAQGEVKPLTEMELANLALKNGISGS